MSHPPLEFTGERFTPECVREIWYEHQHRYAFASKWAAGHRVLDAACGEGYGAATLAQTAASVVALDLSESTIQHARRRYQGIENLQFDCADVTSLDRLSPQQFDLIVSFETLEHVFDQERMLDGFARLLAPGGMLLVSTPDKRVYSDLTGFENEFHVKELYLDEFQALLAQRFGAVKLFGQKLLFQSIIWQDSCEGSAAASTQCSDGLEHSLRYEPVYWIAACARTSESLPPMPAMHCFGDAAESVYQHYNAEIRKNMAAGRRILELESELAELRARLNPPLP